jgi:hypothetical protein
LPVAFSAGLQHALLLLGETAGQTVAGSFEGCALN